MVKLGSGESEIMKGECVAVTLLLSREQHLQTAVHHFSWTQRPPFSSLIPCNTEHSIRFTSTSIVNVCAVFPILPPL